MDERSLTYNNQMKDASASRRIETMDICKGICMLSVILGHQLEKTGALDPLQYLQTFTMPLFFIIAGFFISNRLTIKEYSIKRIKKLLVPYVISCLLAAILCTIDVYLKEDQLSIAKEEFRNRLWITIYGSGSGHGSMLGSFGTQTEIGMMWFLLALLWSSIFVKAISNNRMSGCIALLTSAVAIGTTTLFGWLPLSIQNGLGSVMWVWLGYYIKKKELLKDILSFIYSRWIVLILVAWLISAKYGCTHLYGNFYQLGIIDVAGSLAGSLLVYCICDVLSRKTMILKKCLSWIGKNSLLVYCLHFLEHNVYPISDMVAQTGLFHGPISVAVISWIGVSVVTIIGAAIIRRTETAIKDKIY